MTVLDKPLHPGQSPSSGFLRARWLLPLIGVSVAIALGFWQLERLAWKQDLLARLESRLAAPAVMADGAIDTNPADHEFHRVMVTGQWAGPASFRILARPRGGQAGYEVLTPLIRADGGARLLVNRGFLPLGSTVPGVSEGPVTITGMVRLPHQPGWMQPDNPPDAGLTDPWVRVDPQRMGPVLGAPLAPWVLEAEADPARPGQLVMNGIKARADLPNNHLQYALTWFALAMTLMVVTVLANRSVSTRPKHPLAPGGTTR